MASKSFEGCVTGTSLFDFGTRTRYGEGTKTDEQEPVDIPDHVNAAADGFLNFGADLDVGMLSLEVNNRVDRAFQ
jgi:hypothetical protein